MGGIGILFVWADQAYDLLPERTTRRRRLFQAFLLAGEYPVFLALNVAGMPLNKAGRYSVEILGDGSYLQTLNFRVVVLGSLRSARFSATDHWLTSNHA
jgi:hypothetical protein